MSADALMTKVTNQGISRHDIDTDQIYPGSAPQEWGHSILSYPHFPQESHNDTHSFIIHNTWCTQLFQRKIGMFLSFRSITCDQCTTGGMIEYKYVV